MTKQKDKNQHSLRLAVAAATLGMSMGVNPGVVLASPTVAEPLPNEDVAQEPLQLAAGYVDYGEIDYQNAAPMGAGPDAAYPKVEQPGGQYQNYKQPGVQYPKVEQPGVQYPKVEQPGVQYPKVEQPGVQYPKVEQPGVRNIKMDQPRQNW